MPMVRVCICMQWYRFMGMDTDLEIKSMQQVNVLVSIAVCIELWYSVCYPLLNL